MVASVGVVAAAIRKLIERVVPTPSVAWGDIGAKLVGDPDAILEWTGAGDRRALKCRRCQSGPVQPSVVPQSLRPYAVFARKRLAGRAR